MNFLIMNQFNDVKNLASLINEKIIDVILLSECEVKKND